MCLVRAHQYIKYSGVNSRHTSLLYEYILYRDKIEHKYLVIHMLAIIMYTNSLKKFAKFKEHTIYDLVSGKAHLVSTP